MDSYRRRRLRLRQYLTDVKQQNPDIEYSFDEDRLVIDGIDVSYCEESDNIYIETQPVSQQERPTFSLWDTYQWKSKWREIRKIEKAKD